MNPEEDDVRRVFQKVDAQIKHKKDEDSAHIRDEWNSLDDGSKSKVREIAKQLAELKQIPGQFMEGRVVVRLNVDDEQGIEIRPASLLKMIESWDDGKPYIPTIFGT